MGRAEIRQSTEGSEVDRLVAVLLDITADAPDSLRRRGHHVRAAAEAGAIPLALRLFRGAQETDILRFGPPCRTGGPAVETGGTDRHHEGSIGLGVAIQESCPAVGFIKWLFVYRFC